MMRDSDLGKVLPWPYKLVVLQYVETTPGQCTLLVCMIFDSSFWWKIIFGWLEFHQWNFKLPGSRNNSYYKYTYRKVASSNKSRLEAHDGFFRLLMKGIFDPYVLPYSREQKHVLLFRKSNLFFLVSNTNMRY